MAAAMRKYGVYVGAFANAARAGASRTNARPSTPPVMACMRRPVRWTAPARRSSSAVNFETLCTVADTTVLLTIAASCGLSRRSRPSWRERTPVRYSSAMRFVALVAVLAACERADDPGTAHLMMPPHAEIIVFEPGREPRAPLRTAPTLAKGSPIAGDETFDARAIR